MRFCLMVVASGVVFWVGLVSVRWLSRKWLGVVVGVSWVVLVWAWWRGSV